MAEEFLDYLGEAELLASRFECAFFGVQFKTENCEGIEESDVLGFLVMRILAKMRNGQKCPEYSRAVMYLTHAAGQLEQRAERRQKMGLLEGEVEPEEFKDKRDYWTKDLAARTIENTSLRMQKTAGERSNQLVLRPFTKKEE